MYKSLKKLKTTLLVILLLSSTAFSQVLTLNSKGDTTICFTIAQGKFLAREHARANQFAELDSICRSISAKKDLQIKMFEKIDQKSQIVINNQNSIIKFKDEELKNAQISIKNANREAKKQKKHKVLALIGGALISGYLGFIHITK